MMLKKQQIYLTGPKTNRRGSESGIQLKILSAMEKAFFWRNK
ncbi:hypothetical protein RF007C_15560 [Ruminococcus flavefaciens 007c]|uniref:Uncharacterized protein n=1 Tax=Ruminococcus flavefaciens 007c TaxID=1341157 RepID=W7UGF8_RUMFL|nr:hypothetical protein RF007C_15560 [Ruminococcus flavefaciens 007c]